MAAYRRVYDSRHLQADCREPGSAPEPNARQPSTGYLYLFYVYRGHCQSRCRAVVSNCERPWTMMDLKHALVHRTEPA